MQFQVVVKRIFSAILAVVGSQAGYYGGFAAGTSVCGPLCGLVGAHVGSTAGNMVGSALGGTVGGAALWIYDEMWPLAMDLVNEWSKESSNDRLLEIDEKKIMESLVQSAGRFAFTASRWQYPLKIQPLISLPFHNVFGF